jgi:hypothetical protein
MRIQSVSTSRATAAGLVPRGGCPREREREDQQREDHVGIREGLAEGHDATGEAADGDHRLEQHAHERRHRERGLRQSKVGILCS